MSNGLRKSRLSTIFLSNSLRERRAREPSSQASRQARVSSAVNRDHRPTRRCRPSEWRRVGAQPRRSRAGRHEAERYGAQGCRAKRWAPWVDSRTTLVTHTSMSAATPMFPEAHDFPSHPAQPALVPCIAPPVAVDRGEPAKMTDDPILRRSSEPVSLRQARRCGAKTRTGRPCGRPCRSLRQVAEAPAGPGGRRYGW
jgi:hypothetical protein